VPFTPVLADAILPSLVMVWPAFILMFIPIVAVEVLYSKRRLQMRWWESIRVLGTANLLSSLAGLPLGYILAVVLQYCVEGVYFRNPDRQRAPNAWQGAFLRGNFPKHNHTKLMMLGLYPHWILSLSAAVMLMICFLLSWWIEAKWVNRYLGKKELSVESAGNVRNTLRDANLISYALVIVLVIWIFEYLQR
jgi:hypothetical protein